MKLEKIVIAFLLISFSFYVFFSFVYVESIYSQPNPIESIQPAINTIIMILKDNKLDFVSKKNKIREIIYANFDLEETAKRVMGVNWRQLNQNQKELFILKFKELMENTYISKINTYSDENVVLTNYQIQDNYAKVDGYIQGKSVNTPISFIMHYKSSKWYVYDFIIENVSLVNNYRNTYAQYYARYGFDNLINEMDKKIAELTSQNDAIKRSK